MLNNVCGYDLLFLRHFDIVEGLFNFLVQKDYLDPCAYGETIDKEMNFDVDCDDDTEINNGLMGYKNTRMIGFVIKCTKCDYMIL